MSKLLRQSEGIRDGPDEIRLPGYFSAGTLELLAGMAGRDYLEVKVAEPRSANGKPNGKPRVDWSASNSYLSYEIQEAPMTTQSSMLHVRMDSELKREATQALAAMGLTASEAVRLLFHRIAADQAFPLELKVPNAQTQRAMAEVDEMVKNRTARFASADDMFAKREKASRQ